MNNIALKEYFNNIEFFGSEKILLVTGKFPPQGMDADGGSIMVEQLINILADRCLLDIVFTRTYNRKLEFLSGVQKVLFHTNISRNDNKFFS